VAVGRKAEERRVRSRSAGAGQLPPLVVDDTGVLALRVAGVVLVSPGGLVASVCFVSDVCDGGGEKGRASLPVSELSDMLVGLCVLLCVGPVPVVVSLEEPTVPERPLV
jgi:hypothetical protein